MAIFRTIHRWLGRHQALPPCRVYAMRIRDADGVPGTMVRLSPDGDYSQAAISADGQRVAYWGSSPEIDGHHIWIARVAAASCKRITRKPGVHGHPAWWPDGKSLVCFSTAGVSNARSWDPARQFSVDRPGASLFRIDAMTGDRVRLTHGEWVDERPAVSPCGQHVAFVSNRSGRLNLWLLEVDSGDLRQVTYTSTLDYRPSFSPCGRYLAYFSATAADGHQLVILRWPGLEPVAIDTSQDFEWSHGPAWCSTSNRVLFHALRKSETRPALWLLDIDANRCHRVKLPGIKACSHGSLDRSDEVLAFDSREKLSVPAPAVVD